MKLNILTISLIFISSAIVAQNQPGLHVEENHTVLFGNDTFSGGVKFLWYPSKAAIRAGRTNTSEWIVENVGLFSSAFGEDTEARGKYSSAFGLSTWAFSLGETSFGRYSLGGGNPLSWIGSDALFEIGNGTSSGARSNAFTVYKNGNTELQHSLSIGDHAGTTPVDGTIRWSGTDFEGFSGGEWQSLTQQSETVGSGSVSDIDGNEYLTVTIGNQTWMRENLRVSRYQNGDEIPEVLLNADWAALSSGGWSWYDHDPKYDIPHGKLYNWFVVNDARNVCPDGWRVPSEVDWIDLETVLGGMQIAGGKMKTLGTIQTDDGFWDTSVGPTNESGFTGIPGGYRSETGLFFSIRQDLTMWSSDEFNATVAEQHGLISFNPILSNSNRLKKTGISIRCIQN